jgi:hypothetical protein
MKYRLYEVDTQSLHRSHFGCWEFFWDILLLSVCCVFFGTAFCGGVWILVLSERVLGWRCLILLAVFMLHIPSCYVHI